MPALLVALLLVGCAGRPEPATAPEAAPPSGPAAAATSPAAAPAAEGEQPSGRRLERVSLRELCRQQAAEEEAGLEKSRRVLYESLCSAGLWFDGLLGGEPDVETARKIQGRLELTGIHSDYWGTDTKVRLRLRYDLPNLKHRFNLFLGREEPDEAIQDRRELLPVQSALLDLDEDQEWLAGFGYSPPGRRASKFDFRTGVKVKSETEVYFQGRWRGNLFVGDTAVWRFRETLFYENRDGFGLTSSVDYNKALRDTLLVRWANIGTFSEATDGLAWRSTALLYQNLRRRRALAYEVFVRGETDDPVRVREYGARAIYRFPLKRRQWLFGEVIAGWTFPRGDDETDRSSSPQVGIGVDLLFGPDPF